MNGSESHTLLIVNNDRRFCKKLKAALVPDQAMVLTAHNEVTAKAILEQDDPDVIILDLDSIEATAVRMIELARIQNKEVSLIALGQKRAYQIMQAVYDAGVDSYLRKPFDLLEILILTRRYLRKPCLKNNLVRVQDLVINKKTHEVVRAKRSINLSPKKFELLTYLVNHPNRVIYKEELARNVWKENFERNTNIISVYISYLRKEIDGGFDHKLIHTKVGCGYIFKT
ncbi:MAG: response regulator transcription factor [Bacteroidia bacterium]